MEVAIEGAISDVGVGVKLHEGPTFPTDRIRKPVLWEAVTVTRGGLVEASSSIHRAAGNSS